MYEYDNIHVLLCHVISMFCLSLFIAMCMFLMYVREMNMYTCSCDLQRADVWKFVPLPFPRIN